MESTYKPLNDKQIKFLKLVYANVLFYDSLSDKQKQVVRNGAQWPRAFKYTKSEADELNRVGELFRRYTQYQTMYQ